MKNIPLILVLILAFAWGYTSWYWYVCNIKGLCQPNIAIQEENIDNEDSFFVEDVTSGEDQKMEGNTGNILTSDDVLSSDFTRDERQVVQTASGDLGEDSDQVQLGEETGTGSSEANEEIQTTDEEVEALYQEEKNNIEAVGICETPLVGPIGIGASNNTEEVKLLEEFLINRGENLSVDGVYGNDDFEAVKRFQLEYREQILDPWDIQNPTGYVFRTTVKTINEIACK